MTTVFVDFATELQHCREKKDLRRLLLTSRQSRAKVERLRAQEEIAKTLADIAARQCWQRIAVFLPWRGEPDLRPLWATWHQQELSLALPCVEDQADSIIMRAWQPEDPLVNDALGLPCPHPERARQSSDTWIIPCVGIGPEGERLGAGKGLYDRAVASMMRQDLTWGERPRLVGVCFAEGLIPWPFAESHDLRLDACVTELGWRRFSAYEPKVAR